MERDAFAARVRERLYRTFQVEPLLTEPTDYLGYLISERRSNSKAWNPTAFFPTPHSVVEAMTTMVMFDMRNREHDPRLASVCDPCVGTGRMLLHASNHSLVLHGCDIDPLVLLATRINGALYAPWLAFGVPGLTELTTSQVDKITRDTPRARARLAQIEEGLGRATYHDAHASSRLAARALRALRCRQRFSLTASRSRRSRVARYERAARSSLTVESTSRTLESERARTNHPTQHQESGEMSYRDEVYARSEALFPEEFVTTRVFVERRDPDTPELEG